MKRKDAVLLNDPDPFHSIVPYVMPKRTEAEVSTTCTFDITDLLEFTKKHNEENGTNYKLFHCICTAVARTIYHRPKMNIFIAGRKFWQRKDITLSFVATQKFEDEAVETLMTLKVDPDMNLDSVSKLILGDVKKARSAGNNSLDKTMELVGKLPRFVLEIFFWILSRMEYHGVYPQDLAKGDPNYTTCLLSNLGSIGADSCYHHLSNFGTNSMMGTIGTIYHDQTDNRDKVEMTITIDERIADGFYFAKSLKLLKYFLEHPQTLMEKVSDPVPEDIAK
jgi:pyruvate/2-oxoglutarate dehydrogenase complex dihydrolipoamide acyltransferase (E2) component